MSLAVDKRFFSLPPNSAASLLINNRDLVLATWVGKVKQKIPHAKAEPHPIIIDTLPAFIETLVEALAPNFPRKLATEGNTIAAEHGGERARVTRISPSDLICEYQILRDVIFDFLSRRVTLSDEEKSVIIKSIDQAMEESLTAYFLVHEGLREQFTMTLTHDMRTPLTTIKATSDRLLRNPEQKDIQILARRISECAHRMDRMIEDLLDASQIRFGQKLTFEAYPCELLSLVQETVNQLISIHGNRFNLKGEVINGFWNPDAFKRAVENLLGNAVKYGDERQIDVKVENIQGRAVVSIHNYGPHIPKEEQEALFQSFMRASAAKEGGKKGWGLGLAIVRAMAEGHGGSIAVDSTPERGTTFVIDVPVDARDFLNKPHSPGS